MGADVPARPRGRSRGLAVLRDGVPYAPPPEDLRLIAGDTLVLVGAHEDLARVLTRLETRAAAPAAG